jgi:hypothetical protein
MGARGAAYPGGGFKLAGRSRRSGLCYAGAEKKTLTMEWQPIETAPKDGTRLLGYDVESSDMAVVYWCEKPWTREWRLVVCGGWAEDDEWEPTHWMPLPDPPKTP